MGACQHKTRTMFQAHPMPHAAPGFSERTQFSSLMVLLKLGEKHSKYLLIIPSVCVNFDSWEHSVGKQSDLYCRSFRVLEASATLTCPTSRTGSSLPPEAAPCIRKTPPRGPKEYLATYQEAQVSLRATELSFMVMKRKQTQRKDSETPPGQQGPSRHS